MYKDFTTEAQGSLIVFINVLLWVLILSSVLYGLCGFLDALELKSQSSVSWERRNNIKHELSSEQVDDFIRDAMNNQNLVRGAMVSPHVRKYMMGCVEIFKFE